MILYTVYSSKSPSVFLWQASDTKDGMGQFRGPAPNPYYPRYCDVAVSKILLKVDPINDDILYRIL